MSSDPQEVQCPECASTMPADALFCGVCGKNLGSQSQLSQSQGEDASDWAPEPTRLSGQNAESRQEFRTLVDDFDTRGATSSRPVSRNVPDCVAEEKSPSGSIRPMMLIPAGWFAMGSDVGRGNDNERPIHQVQLSAYYMDRAAVSNAEFERFRPDHRRLRPPECAQDDDPVVFVSYRDCIGYCDWRCVQEGVPIGTYGLPSEAQWERASRGGFAKQEFPWGNTLDEARFNAAEVGLGKAMLVTEGVPNGFGLYHMGDNVREWCLDYYSETFYEHPLARRADPMGPPDGGYVSLRVVRGASFQEYASEFSRCAARGCAHEKTSSGDIGFRCCRLESS